MPVYNARDTLKRAVESVLGQRGADFELILVDDGSVDASPGLCDGYAARDSRVRVIHQANAGVSAARNAGLDAARGEYVAFVDADDEMEPGWLEACCRALEDSRADALLFGWRKIYTRGGKPSTVQTHLPPFQGVITGEQLPPYLDALCAQPGSVCFKMFRLETLRRAGIRFRPMRVAEDGLFSLEALLAAERIFALDQPFYRYLVREDSAMHRFTPSTPEDLFQYAAALAQAVQKDRRFAGNGQALARRAYGEAFVSLTALMAEKGCGLSVRQQINCIRQAMENPAVADAVRCAPLHAFARLPRIKLILCRWGAYGLAVLLGRARKRML